MRSVELHSLPSPGAAPWPWRAYFTPHASDPLASVDISLVLTDGSYEGPLSVSLAFDGGAAEVHALNASTGRASLLGVKVPGARPWSPATPHLHTAEVGVGGGSVIERFGLRTFGVDKATSRLTINGEVLKLTGWNHHTQWPGQGNEAEQLKVTASPTDAQLDADVALLKRGGANFVRGAHYPQDPRWLDRMDESGFAMWSETLGPGVSVADTQDAAWRAVQRVQLDEMMDGAMNHASIVTWGWFNEGPSDKAEACPAYAENAQHAAKRDPTRFGTWASNRGLNDVCLEHASLVSFNSYPAWCAALAPHLQPIPRHAPCVSRSPRAPRASRRAGTEASVTWTTRSARGTRTLTASSPARPSRARRRRSASRLSSRRQVREGSSNGTPTRPTPSGPSSIRPR